MPYNMTIWKDHVTDRPNTYNQTKNEDGTITQTRAGNIIQQGTLQSADNFNNMENGIFENREIALTLLQQAIQNKRAVEDIEGEIINKTLTNNQEYPFNNSKQTIAMNKARDTLNYRVAVEVESAIGGFVGDVQITEKALNGFKLSYNGSATSVDFKIYIQGGMNS